MKLSTLLRLEFFKSRRQYILWVEAAFLAFLALYGWFSFRKTDPALGWMDVIYTVPILDALLLPLFLAVLASRLCEAEHKGSTFKLLETMALPRSLFAAKLLCGLAHVAVLTALQTLLYVGMGFAFGFQGPLPAARLATMTGLVFLVSGMIFLLQLGLSLLFANQLIPLTVGVAGSFLGMFTMFFPPVFQRFLPCGYYGVLMQVGMNWDAATRVIDYYWVEFDFIGLALLALWYLALLAVLGGLFARKEV